MNLFFKKSFQKFIAIVLIFGLILSLNFNVFLVKPKKAKALDLGGSWAQVIKETVLDAIGWTVTDIVLNRLEQQIIDWGMGRKSDARSPFAVSDWVQYFKDAVELGAARFVNEQYQRAFDTSDPFQREIKSTLDSLGLGTLPSDFGEYRERVVPTLKQDLGPELYQRFIESNYSLNVGGLNAWFSLLKPENNIYDQYFMARNEKEAYEQAQKEAADKETAVSRGFVNEVIATETDIDACKFNCSLDYPKTIMTWDQGEQPNPDYEECIQRCEMKPGLALKTRIKNWGTTIEKYMTDALGKDMSRIISADEISELIGVIFSALLNRTVNIGLGALSGLTNPTKKEITRREIKEKYNYYQNFKKSQTKENIQDIRSTLLSGILDAVQQLSRSITSCDEDEMLTYEDYTKNLADILDSNVEALYVGLEGVNLKPDFQILDPRFAPYTVYGYSYGHIPATKYPPKCQKIVEQAGLNPFSNTCVDIKSGLEPNYDARCEQCMYDHDALACPPGPTPPLTYPNEIPESTIKQKQDFYNACRGWYLVALDRCEDCIKKADEKCGQLDEELKEDCIRRVCNNYQGIEAHITGTIIDGLDFYNKCLIEEQKDACYTCLREYFVPATYCEQIQDYIARAIIKYPTVVHDKARNRNPWLGPYDEIIGSRGDACSDNDDSQPISLALICRILPDYKYQGQKVCETWCNNAGMTEEQLRDITDFRPYEKDCNKRKLPIGGKETWLPVSEGVLRTKGKCCGALWQHDKTKYAYCVGVGESTEAQRCTYAKPVEQEPWCYCEEGQRIIAAVHNGKPSFVSESGGECANACSNTTFTVPNMKHIDKAVISSNAAPAGSVIYIAENSCKDEDFAQCKQGKECDYVAEGPSKVICEIETQSAKAGTGYCTGSGGNAATGVKTMICDLSDYINQTLKAGVYNDDPTDGATGIHICVPCDPTDPGYPYYGTDYDQCNNKI